MKYVGLTNDPVRRRQEHGNPPDWEQQRHFDSELEARQWEADRLAEPDTTGAPGGKGWRYGYMYTITPQTIQ